MPGVRSCNNAMYLMDDVIIVKTDDQQGRGEAWQSGPSTIYGICFTRIHA